MLPALTLFHVAISLVGIFSGFVVIYGMLKSNPLNGWTSLFLWTTVATSVSGFLFPVHHFTRGHAVGLLSLIVLAVAIFARYRRGMAGHWRATYIITAIIAQYFNVFVLIVQSFEKVPALKSLAPTQSEPPFKFTQLAVLVLFVVFAIVAVLKFRSEPREISSASPNVA